MKIYKFINSIDNIIEKSKEIERQNSLFSCSSNLNGLGFIGHISDSNGNCSTIIGNESGGIGTYIIDGITYHTNGF